jgi:hypothetical protein
LDHAFEICGSIQWDSENSIRGSRDSHGDKSDGIGGGGCLGEKGTHADEGEAEESGTGACFHGVFDWHFQLYTPWRLVCYSISRKMSRTKSFYQGTKGSI